MDSRQLQIVLKMQDDASKELQKVIGSLNDADTSTNSLGISMGKLKVTALAAGTAIGTAAVGMVGYGVKIAAQLETAEIGFRVLLGSSKAATETIARLKKEAARTPFELVGLTQATQALSLVTKDGPKSIDILMNVGKALASAGKGQVELDRIIMNLQQIGNTGKITEMDVRQFGMNGVNILEMLADYYGTTKDKASEMVKTSANAFDDLVGAFAKAGSEGGRFANGFSATMGSFDQLWSNLKDSAALFSAEFVKQTGIFDSFKIAMDYAAVTLSSFNFESTKQEFIDLMQTLNENTGIITLLTDSWLIIIDVFNTNLFPALQQLWVALLPFAPYLKDLAGVLGTSLVISIASLIIIFGAFVTGLATVLTWATKIGTYFATGLIKYFDWLGSSINGVIEWVDKLISKFERAIELASRVMKSVGGSIGGAVSSVKSAVGLRASGGPVSSGSPYIVGEKGPELFVPSSSGTIIPNGAGGGVVVNVYGDVSGQELIQKVTNAITKNIKYQVKLS